MESRLSSSEQAAAAENEALRRRLEEGAALAQKTVTSALAAAEEAAAAVRRHAQKAYAAIDSGEADETLYAVAAEVAQAKKELLQAAEEKMSEARWVLFFPE